MSLSKTIMTNVRSPEGDIVPNPDKDKVHWTIRCDHCYNEIVHWKDDREDLDPIKITRYRQQEIEDERGRTRVFSPNGRLPLLPDVYRLRNSNRDLCKDCYECYDTTKT
jgi:hypothetical protein